MSDTVQQIKDRLSIVDVVTPYVDLHNAGKNLKGKSPFTNEKTPSFYVSPDRGMYYCFSTSQGGDIFTFVEKMEGVDFKGALKILAERAGVELVPEDPQKKSERDRQYDVLEAATAFYEQQLRKESAATDYLTRRGVTSQTINKWRIGYAPGPPQHGWRETRQQLAGRSFTDAEMQKAGLIKGGDAGKEPYDVFRDRVMFPIFDPSGRVVAFSGRILSKDSEAPKYVNSPETELFSKSDILFGYDKAKQGIRQYDFSLIVEGQFDVVMSHQAGYTNAVAVSGTALTDHQVALLQRLSNRVVLALDADRAGIAAVKRGATLMLARGMDVKVARLPEGKDPADMVGEGGGGLKDSIKSSSHVIEFLLDVLEAEASDDRTFKLKAHAEVLPFVIAIPNRIDQEHFEKVIADRLQTTKEAVHTEVERQRARVEKTNTALAPEPVVVVSAETASAESGVDRVANVEAHLVHAVDVLPASMAARVAEAIETVSGESIATLKDRCSAEQSSQLIFTLEERYQSVPKAQLRNEIAHLLGLYETAIRKVELRTAHEALKAAEADGGDTAAALQAIATAQKRLGEAGYSEGYFTVDEEKKG